MEQRKENEEEIKLDDAVEKSEISSIAIVAASSDINVSSTPMFKLIIDCFDHLFEWLTLRQLLLFRLTCNRMRLVVNQYTERNYPKLKILSIRKQHNWLEFCHTPLDSFKLIKRLHLKNVHLNGTEMDGITYVLNQLELLYLYEVQIDDDLYEVILKHCHRLKTLYLGGSTDTIIGPKNDWLLRQYPTLERFNVIKLQATATSLCPELLIFFKQNPSIRSFGINSAFLSKHRHLFQESKLKFDHLSIFTKTDGNDTYHLLNDLHKCDFFKEVEIYDSHSPFSNVLQYPSFDFNLKKLCLEFPPPENISVPVVESIKKLFICRAAHFQNDILNQMATNFTNLQFVRINGNLNDVRPFICNSPKLRTIDFCWSSEDTVNITDVIALNELRKRLTGAHKITIFVGETAFMKLKWLAKVKFSMIEWKPFKINSYDQ